MTTVRAQSVLSKSTVLPTQPTPSRGVRQPCTHLGGERVQLVVHADRSTQNCEAESSLTKAACEVHEVEHASLSEQALPKEGPSSVSCVTATSLAVFPILLGGPALAYTRVDAEEILKDVAGGAYLLLVGFFFFRLFRKRAYTSTSQSFRTQVDEEQRLEQAAAQDKAVTPLGALWGAAQAGIICFFLFQGCGLVDAYFDHQELPTQFTARNVTVALRTVIRGLAYLATFLFAANFVGLTGLSAQLLLFPESQKEQEEKPEQEKSS